MFGGWGRMCEICKYAFKNLNVYKQKNVSERPIPHYYLSP